MKPETQKELQMIRELVDRIDLTDNTPEGILFNRDQIDEIRKQVARIFFMEAPAVSTKFDIYKMVMDDKIRPAMCGVFHDDGFRVASDAKTLFAVKSDYPAENEGVILDKKGDVIEGCKYPKWKAVIPSGDPSATVTVDTAKVYDFQKKVKAENKSRGRYMETKGIVKVGEAFFAVDLFVKVCKFMDAFGCKEIQLYGNRRAAKVVAPDGSLAIIMPVVGTPYRDADGRYHSDGNLAEMYEAGNDSVLWCNAA